MNSLSNLVSQKVAQLAFLFFSFSNVANVGPSLWLPGLFGRANENERTKAIEMVNQIKWHPSKTRQTGLGLLDSTVVRVTSKERRLLQWGQGRALGRMWPSHTFHITL